MAWIWSATYDGAAYIRIFSGLDDLVRRDIGAYQILLGMKYAIRIFLGGFILAVMLAPGSGMAQPVASANPVEELINRFLTVYPLWPDNRFRLAIWTELKGQYDPATGALELKFGDLATMTFYERNCLLRTRNHRIFHLEREESPSVQSLAMNRMLAELFETVLLLGNHGADSVHIQFVDQYLAKKNIEPFEKLFLRHILIRYGRYEPQYRRIEFRTEWLPETTYAYRDAQDSVAVRKPIDPMRLKLDETILRGYYIKSGGTVYVEDVTRKVIYATGETYQPNITAFKLFAQKLFSQTTQYIVLRDQHRVDSLEASFEDGFDGLLTRAAPLPQATHLAGQPEGYRSSPRQIVSIQPLYGPDSFVSMILGLLRSRGIEVYDPDIAPYLVRQTFFPQLMELLSEEERLRMMRFVR
ncbi:MAG: hypothetical protein SF053_15730 [Bacteroidia bacterium]|nr:hypothetical protein [Bacteroidia bacterium]